jgi:hypothetical protein
VAELAQHVVADVAIAHMPALCFSILPPHVEVDTTSDIGQQHIQLIHSTIDLGEKTASAILDARNSLLDQDLVAVLIQLREGDVTVLEARDEEDTSELDFFSCLAGERHTIVALNWNQ